MKNEKNAEKPPPESIADFKLRIAAIMGSDGIKHVSPSLKRPAGSVTPSEQMLADVIASGKTIWNSDGTDGPVLICAPPPKGGQ